MRCGLLALFLIVIGTPLWSCSCVLPPYESLCEVIEGVRSDGENIVVVRITAVTAAQVEMVIERELVGSAPFREFTFRRGNGADCGISLTGAKAGDRFLGHFAFTEERREYGASICGYRNKVWSIRDGAIEYPNDREVAASGAEPWTIYFGLETLFATGDCVRFAETNNLRDGLLLWPNPTPELLRLDTVQAISPIYQMELFDVTGRRLQQWSGPFAFPFELNLGGLPSGVYLLRVFADRQRQVFRIVKT